MVSCSGWLPRLPLVGVGAEKRPMEARILCKLLGVGIQKGKWKMINTMKYASLVMFALVAFPVVLTVQIILGVLWGILYSIHDLIHGLSMPEESRWYVWMGWDD